MVKVGIGSVGEITSHAHDYTRCLGVAQGPFRCWCLAVEGHR